MDCQTGKGPPPCIWTFVASVVCWCTYSIFNDSLHHPYICECFCRKPFYSPYIYIYIYISVTKWRSSGYLEFTKLLLALSSFSKPFDQMRSIQEHYFIILSHRQACAVRYREETAGKRRGPVTKWPPRRLLFIRLEIVFVIISSFTERTKVVHE